VNCWQAYLLGRQALNEDNTYRLHLTELLQKHFVAGGCAFINLVFLFCQFFYEVSDLIELVDWQVFEFAHYISLLFASG
jgi:hypothetical protein